MALFLETNLPNEIPSDLWGKLPTPLIFILAIIFIVISNINKLIEVYDKIKNWEKKKHIINLKIHDMFLTIEKVRQISNSYEYSTYNEFDETKTILLKHLINLKLDTIDKKFKGFLDDKSLKYSSGQELKFKVGNILNNIVFEYCKIVNQDYIRVGISHKDSEFLINSYEKYRAEIIDGMKERIESICSNNDYNSNYDRISAILEIVAIVLYTIPGDVRETFNEINGRFKTYKDKDIRFN